MGDTYDVE